MKPIQISSQHKEKIIKKFHEELEKARLSNGTFNFNVKIDDTLPKDTEKPNIQINSDAYLKMITLISDNTGEVGWHGIVYRNENTFLISDIVVYPQEVSGANVTTDEKEYGEWLHLSLDDETFNHLRFHGHSHVNMTASPSGTDDQMYHNILQTLGPDDYYIFAIMNKKLQSNFWIYDFAQNIIFEDRDITLEVIDSNGNPINEWNEENKKLIKEKKFNTSYTWSPYHEDYYFGAVDESSDMYSRFQNQVHNEKPMKPQPLNNRQKHRQKGGKTKR